MTISRSDLLKLARAGAEARIRELQGEIDSIRRTFPSVRGGGRGSNEQTPGRARRRKKPNWSAAQRKAVADRMKKYWAERRKAKAAKARKSE